MINQPDRFSSWLGRFLAGMPIEQDARVAIFAIIMGAILIAVAVVFPARGGEVSTHRYIFMLYSAERGTPPSRMQYKLSIGPLPALSICYALGAIGMEGLNAKFPNKDFMGRCDDVETETPGSKLFTMREIADKALALLPKEPKP